jgi:hypothetical protein
MKKMILSAAALMAFTAAAYAQDATSANATPAAPATASAVPAAQAGNTETRTQMDVNALPEGVKQTLAADQYKDWKLVSAWYIRGTSEYYVVEMQKGEEKNTLKLNKDGKPA